MKLSLRILLILWISGLMVEGCQPQKKAGPAHLRALSVVQFASAKLTIQGKGKNKHVHQVLPLGYSNPVPYLKLSPGYYDITTSVDGKQLLRKTFALGKDGYYTILALGLLPERWEVNPHTTMYRLKYIFAGEELESANQYLPQWYMMRDNYDGSKKSAYIRLVNANPFTSLLSIKNSKKTLTSGLAYPMESDMLKLKAGTHTLQIFYGKVKLGEKKIDAQAGYIYTAVISNKQQSGSHSALAIQILENPARTLLETRQSNAP